MEVSATPNTQMVLYSPHSNSPVRSNKRKEREHESDTHAAKKDTNGPFVTYAERVDRGYGWVSH
jgi:hypothetical protein